MSLLPNKLASGLVSRHVDLIPSPHGGIDYAELEKMDIAPEEVIDFSANLNPFGPPPEVVAALSESGDELSKTISHYPDSESRHLRCRLAEKLGVKEENIIVGNGSTELIRLAALAYFRQREPVLIIEPTFGEYKVACCIAGASVVKQQLSAENAFQLNLDETTNLIRRHHPKGIFVANPNNPTGRYFSQTEFGKLLHASQDSLVVLDEAYISFVENGWSSLDLALHSSLRAERSNLLILRSMTKDYALAGLRLGYGVANEEIIAALRRICPPWNVNALAQKAGVVALENEEYLGHCKAKIKEAKEYLVTELSHIGLFPLPSEASFFLVKVGDATAFRRTLLQRRILVRDCASFGLPSYIRIAPRTMPECQILVAAVREIITLQPRYVTLT